MGAHRLHWPTPQHPHAVPPDEVRVRDVVPLDREGLVEYREYGIRVYLAERPFGHFVYSLIQ
jgi:hypothetical protein